MRDLEETPPPAPASDGDALAARAGAPLAAEAVDGSWLGKVSGSPELGRLVATHDWGSTSLGSPAEWPDSLRIVVQLCLASRFPLMVAWGPDHIQIYNDGFRPILGGGKHPEALGAPAEHTWSEIWDEIGPLFDSVLHTGEPVWAADQRLEIERDGALQETFFTYSYSPIHDRGAVAGLLVACVETTSQVLDRRRLVGLARLAEELLGTHNVAEVAFRTVEALDGSPDLRSAEFHIGVGSEVVRVASNGRPIALADDAVALGDAARRRGILVLGPQGDAVEDPVRRVAVGLGDDDTSGVLVVSTSALQPFDAAFREFLELLGRAVGTSLANAHRRSAEVGEQRHISNTLQQAMIHPAADFPTVAARYLPAAGNLSVGGDWYDVISLGSGRRALVVGDCVGHGLEAATVMGALRNVSRALLADGHPPATVLASLDRFARTTPGALCTTVACAVIDVRARTLDYARAGHPPLGLVRDGAITWLEGGRGLPLAVGHGTYSESRVALEAQDLLVLYTDGLVEDPGHTFDEGLDLLARSVLAHRDEPVQVIADCVIDELVSGKPRDDIALVIKRLHVDDH